ncbi:hypothetical protein C3L33_16748, partial [Rhododendron williamsianum]
MAERSLKDTPTWAVAVVCFVLVLVSIVIEHLIHLIGSWLRKRHKRSLYEALEKIKEELMLLGFMSLLLTVTQDRIAEICIPRSDKVQFVSAYGIHQLHIFIFVLALFHVLYCITTLGLGTLKMRKWKTWEDETKTLEYQYQNVLYKLCEAVDLVLVIWFRYQGPGLRGKIRWCVCSADPERFRFARETSFGRRHMDFWSHSPVLLWIVRPRSIPTIFFFFLFDVCFFRQFFRSVAKVDYLTLRHGFVIAHLSPQREMNFDFRKYISRSLEEDFKVVVGIRLLILSTVTKRWFSWFD